MGKLAGGTEEFARKLEFSVGRHLMFWTLRRLPDPVKNDVTLLIGTYFTLQKPGSVFGRGTLLRDGPNGLCHTSSATPSEQRRELILDLAWLSSNPNQVSPAGFI